MGPRASRGQPSQIQNISKNLLIQLAFPQVGEKFEKAEFFYKTRQMKIYIPVENEKVILDWSQNIQLLHQESMKNFILLPKSYEFQKQGYCGSSGMAKIVYDYFPYSLEGEIQNRKKSIDNQQFSEPEIWKILFILLKASQLLHKNWRKVGDIRPKNILYNQEKQLRIGCQFSYPRQLTNYQKFLFQKQPSYLAPEQLYDIRMGRIQPNKSRNAKQHTIQAESWSIGLTMLHVALLFNFQKIYDTLKYQINIDLLHQKLKDLQNKNNMSQALKNVIKGMLQQIPQRRLLSSEIVLPYLEQFQEQIKKLQPFDTQRLNVEVKELMKKKSQNSLIGTVWKACSTGLIQSLVINRNQNQRLDTQTHAKETLLRQLEKYSQIQPKNSQVSVRQSIRLGRSRNKMTQSNVFSKIKQSQVSNESFHTVGSLRFSKKDANQNRILGFGLENRFGTHRLPTSNSNFSPQKTHLFDNVSQKFMTPLEQSSYFHTIHGNQKSFQFNFNSLGALNSTFRFSQAVQDKNFFDKIQENTQQKEPGSPVIEGNFKKEKSKQKK